MTAGVRPALRLLPRLARGRLARAAAALGAGLLLLAPALRVPASGQGDRLDGPIAALLAAAAVWLSAGTVSGLRRDGAAALWLVRPVARSALLGVRLLAALPAVAIVAAGLSVAAGARGGTWVPSGAPLPAGAVLAACAAWLLAGGVTVLCSALLERGDGLLAGLLLFAPLAAVMAGTAASGPGRWIGAVLPPSADLLALERALLAGGMPADGDVVRVLAWGILGAAAGIAIGARRDYRPS